VVDGQLAHLSILIRISQALAANLELAPLLETVHTEVSRVFDAQSFYIALHRQGSPLFSFALQVEHGQRQPVTHRSIETGMTGYILRTGQCLFFPCIAEKRAFLERERILSPGEPAKSWMGVPLRAGEQVVGAMAIQNYAEENAFTREDLDLFSAIASQIAVTVRNAQLYEDVQRRARELEAIASAGRDLTSTLDLEALLSRIADRVCGMLTEDSVAIFFQQEDGMTFRAAAASGRVGESLKSFVLHRGKGILGSIAESGHSEIVIDTTADPRAIHIAGTNPTVKGEKLMAVPLLSQERVIGVMGVWRTADEPTFEPKDLEFLEGIGRQASVAVRNAQLFGQAKMALSEAEAANRAKSSFLASMSHELRTPLNAILLYSELLLEDVNEHGMKELAGDLEKIQGAGKHLLGLIDDILDLSKIEAGRMTVFLEDCDLAPLLDDIAATVRPLVAKNGNRFLMEIDPGLGTLRTDHRKLRQTLFNLLSNAAKFTREGLVQLRADREPGQVCFRVSDTGIGMSPEQVDRVFREFYQAEDAISRKFGGTGLGLTLCRKFVNLLGGEIRLDSREGEGSMFAVRIPIP